MKILLLLLVFAAGAPPARAQVTVAIHPDQQALLVSKDPQLAANKKLVFDFWREVFQARNMDLAPKYMSENYIQHNPTVPTGRKAFMDFFGRFERQAVRPTIDNLVAIVAERDLVVLAFRRDLPDSQKPGQSYTTTWFDMLRIENGRIAEHWDYGTRSAK
jgi:predicted SnoaL-like aldol condensation-catalyzing enzyme